MTDRHAYTIWIEAGSVLAIVGVYGSWVTVGSSAVTGTADGNHGWIVLIAALVGGGVFWFRRTTRSAGVYVVLAGLVSVAAVAYDRAHLADAIGGGKVVAAAAAAGWGLDLALVASVSMVVAGAAWLIAMTALPWAWLESPREAVSRRPSAIELAARENEQAS